MKKLISLLLSLVLALGLSCAALAEGPERIVVLPVWAAEMLLPMVGAERIAGISSYMDDATVTYDTEEAAQVENRVHSGDVEGILMLEPDLVVLDTFNDWDGSLTKTLQDAGLTVLQLESPMNFDQIVRRLQDLGVVTKSEEVSSQMSGELKARLAAVAEKVAEIPQDQRVTVMFYEDAYDPTGASAGMLTAYGAGSTFDAIAQAAGVVNVCNADNYTLVSKETLVADWQPQMLIVPSTKYDENFVGTADEGKTLIASILADETLQTLPAVENAQVFSIDDRARSSVSQHMVEAVETLAKMAYPDLFEE